MQNDRTPARHAFLIAALRSLMTGDDYPAKVLVSSQDRDNIIRSGLGPILHYVLSRSKLANKMDEDSKLKSSDLTSRVLTAEQFDNTAHTLEILGNCNVEVVLLKGTSFALNYYPEPHLRIMGDIDLLLPPDRIGVAEIALEADGFEKIQARPGFDYDSHIHSAPMFHPERKIWVELHRSLLPADFPASQESPLNLNSFEQLTEEVRMGRHIVRRFQSEFELLYLANGWCFDLTHDFGPGLARSLVDCTFLLKTTENHLDWDTVLLWSKGAFSGACLLVLLSFLVRHGVYIDHRGICDQIQRSQKCVNSATLNIMHNRIEKHLVRFESFGWLMTQTVTASVFEALLRKSAAWKNLLAIPGSILFPRREPRKYQVGYQLSRLLSPFERR